MKGKIVITDNKVKFKYYKLEKPNIDDYDVNDFLDGLEDFHRAMRKHEASKQLIEVNNDLFYEIEHIISAIDVKEEIIYIENGQKCEAEIANNVAVITKVL